MFCAGEYVILLGLTFDTQMILIKYAFSGNLSDINSFNAKRKCTEFLIANHLLKMFRAAIICSAFIPLKFIFPSLNHSQQPHLHTNTLDGFIIFGVIILTYANFNSEFYYLRWNSVLLWEIGFLYFSVYFQGLDFGIDV